MDWVWVVLQALGHLAAVLRLYEAVTDEVFEGGLVEERRGEHHEGVEPATGLVDTLGDEIGGKRRLEAFLVFKRIVRLFRMAKARKHHLETRARAKRGVRGGGGQCAERRENVHTATATRRPAWANATPHRVGLVWATD